MAVTADLRRAYEAPSELRLQTSVRLRWFAVFGQLLAIGVVTLWLGFSVPVMPCLVLIGASAALNVILRLSFPARYRLSPGLATVLLVYDLTQLGGLLYLTGGANNPFLMLIVAPVTVSAATLPARNTIGLAVLTIGLGLLMAFVHWPLPWAGDGSAEQPLIYKLGMLASVYTTMAFLGLYAWRLAKEARQMSTALAATELVLAREQRLHALDGLAAAAAHELGTPLATIVVTAKELEREIAAGAIDPKLYADDIRLLSAQAMRCREILQKLSRTPETPDPVHATLSLTHLIEEAAAPHRARRSITIDASPDASARGEPEPVGARRPGVLFGLGNLIENAAAYAVTAVGITARWTAGEVRIVIMDDGPGFTPDILDALGEPYVTSRAIPGPKSAGDVVSPAKGLGLGFFIAKTLLERSGASVVAANRADTSGASVTVTWPRAAFE